jgi:hypothetical protein
MSDTWTIAGQAGKSVNATARPLEDLRIQGMRVNFQSMAVSTMTWMVWLKDTTEISTYTPDLRQTMTLYLNGDRFFTGWVIGRDPQHSTGRIGYRITVADAWYFLANTMLSSEVLDGTGASAERPIYLLPSGYLEDHLQSVVSRAVALGMPVQAGAMADGFEVPRLSMQNQSIAASLADLMAWMADGVMWLDHSGSGDVAVKMSRRGSASTITVEHGTAIITAVDLKPRVDLEVEQVKLGTAKRYTSANKRVTQFVETSAGSITSVLPTRGLIAITGPEINLTLPQDLTDSVEITVATLTATAALQHAHELLRQAGAPYPEATLEQLTEGAFGATMTYPQDPLITMTDPDGNVLSTADWPHFLTQGEPRDWWTKDGIEYIQARVTATVMSTWTDPDIYATIPDPPKWARLVGARQRSIIRWVNGIVGGDTELLVVWEATISASVWAVRGLTSGTLIRKEDWGWFNPPPGLAANLLASQNFVPWEGSVTTVQEVLAHNNPVGSKLNITEWVPETATMGALITGCTIIPRTGEVVYQCGPPLRHSFLDLVNRFRQSGSDNYFWLADPDDDGSTAGGWTDPEAGPPDNATITEGGDPELTEGGDYTLDES